MKKVFMILAAAGILALAAPQVSYAQDAEPAAAEEQVEATVDEAIAADDVVADSVAEAEEPATFHAALKQKFIEGGPLWMTPIILVLVLGLALCIERILYLLFAKTNCKKLLTNIEDALAEGGIEAAKDVARDTRGPVASIMYQGLLHADQGVEVVERTITSYGGVQMGLLEKGLSWIALFIALAPSLGFLGTVIGMIQAFDDIQKAGDISPNVVAGGMKVALITTVAGLIVAMILQVFYNLILALIEGLTTDMEDSSITLVDILTDYEKKNK
ncbi:MAG: MotA/TolQ/ExbB proton channel family protein [Bacteroidales bacterium]|nr:MotA/TolQ/ExbB proton channel family protein [Bacteroidales bacterium]